MQNRSLGVKVCANKYMHIRLGQKGVNFGNSLTVSGVCYMGAKNEDVAKYFGKKCVYLCPT